MKIALVAIYNGVDYYPPTINAIDELAVQYDRVIVLELGNYIHGKSFYKDNVMFHSVIYKPRSYGSRLKTYLRFINQMRTILKKEFPSLILFYDPPSAFAAYLTTLGKKQQYILWYHNHDTIDKATLPKWSIGYLTWIFEEKIINHLSVFSLPAEERKLLFNLKNFKGRYVLIPNFPSQKRYGKVHVEGNTGDPIKLLYQGRISPGHGIEEVIGILSKKVHGKKLHLVLKGIISPSYKDELEKLMRRHGVKDAISFESYKPYSDLPAFTVTHHIGLAIYTGRDDMNSTLGTASNKVYEYTACGMPFLYFDNEHFRSHYAGMDWAFPTDLTESNLLQCLEKIELDYKRISGLAKQAFLEKLNFEAVFAPVVRQLNLSGSF